MIGDEKIVPICVILRKAAKVNLCYPSIRDLIRDHKYPDIDPATGSCKKEGIETVEEAAMTGHDVPAVLYPRHSFHLAFKQVADSSGNCSNARDTDAMHKRKTCIIPGETHHDDAEQGAARCSFPGFFG